MASTAPVPLDLGTKPFIGAIADDLTGATDLALTFARESLKVRQIVGVPEAAGVLRGAGAVVISLKSRTIAAEEAVVQSRAAAQSLLDAGSQQLFFKYCSTFDSTDEGNIGPVIETLLDLLGETRTLACPAFPANGRTVYRGHLFVGDLLLSDSSMRDHPLTPMRDANLVRVLQRQTMLPVSLIAIETVRAGAATLKQALDETDGIAIVDALDDQDLRIIGEAAKDFRLVTGGSGVAMGLPQNFKPASVVHTPLKMEVPAGRAVILAGSCSSATRHQVEIAIASGMRGFRLDPIAIANGEMRVEEAAAFARSTPAAAVPIIYATDVPEGVAASQKVLGRKRAGAVVEKFLSALSGDLVASGFNRMIVAGGETSGAVIAGLGVKTLEIGPEIDAGVPWTTSVVDGAPIALALKSGNFGSGDIFIRAWDLLK